MWLRLQPTPAPAPSNANLLINELIREYLLYNHHHHTLSVFLPEAHQPAQPAFDRAFMARELGLQDSTASRSVPLLYHLTHPSYQGSGGREDEESRVVSGRVADASSRALYSDDDSQRPQRIDRAMLS